LESAKLELSELKVSIIDKDVSFHKEYGGIKGLMHLRHLYLKCTFMAWFTKELKFDGDDLYNNRSVILIFLN